MTTYTESEYIGEWLKAAFDYPNYCVETMVIEQNAGATVGLVSGELLEDGTGVKKVIITTGTNCNAILLEPVTLADNLAGDVNRPCLVRGPARIDSDNVTVTALQKADALTALAALNIIAVNSALTTWNTQTL